MRKFIALIGGFVAMLAGMVTFALSAATMFDPYSQGGGMFGFLVGGSLLIVGAVAIQAGVIALGISIAEKDSQKHN